MGASIEWTSGIIRIGKDHSKKGDPYTVSVSVLKHGNISLLFGMTGKLAVSDRRLIIKILKESGIDTVIFFRDIKGSSKTIKI